MSNIARMMQRATAGAAGGAGLDVDNVFSTFLYEGTSSSLTINNGIDLSGEGGLTWIKARNFGSSNHALFDTARGGGSYLQSNETSAQETPVSAPLTFNSNGFTINTQADSWNGTYYSNTYTSWTFRKAKKFFDVVTYTGNGSAQTISHNLGTTVGWLLIKRTDTTGSWFNYHHGFSKSGNPQGAILNETGAAFTANASLWNLTYPTSTHFTVGDNNSVNASGGTYVAYLFAHNDSGDGGFGPDGDQDIIKCGSYTGNTSGDLEINVGFEPQWVLIKNASASRNWQIVDIMRGFGNEATSSFLAPSSSAAENANLANIAHLTSTGFKLDQASGQDFNENSNTFIYMAIRRGPLAAPEDATKVFDVFAGNDSSYKIPTGFVTDLVIGANRSGSDKFIGSRLTGRKAMRTNTTQAEGSGLPFPTDAWQYNDGVKPGFFAASTAAYWLWKRAPSYFDVVAYTGNGTARTISHNLGAVPEMIWIKKRANTDGSGTGQWCVYHSGLGGGKVIQLNNFASFSTSDYFPSTQSSSDTFSIGTQHQVNGNGSPMIAYLFATVAGVSKVGSYTGNGTGQNIDCGFSSGARFVLIKKTSGTGDWIVHDSVRGIVSGNDGFLELNTTNAENSNFDVVDPYASGFAVTTFNDWNEDGHSYIFYAIA